MHRTNHYFVEHILCFFDNNINSRIFYVDSRIFATTFTLYVKRECEVTIFRSINAGKSMK